MRTRYLKIFGFLLFATGMVFSLFAFGCANRKARPTQLKVHPVGWDSLHVSFVYLNSLQPEYGMACRSCHGEDYTGGSSGVSCVGCHYTRRDLLSRPLFCIVCHGDTTDFTGAPPASLAGKTDDTVRGVGAHRVMLYGRSFFAGTNCQTCHIKPAFVLSPGHFTPTGAGADGRAEVVFSGLPQLFSSRYGTPVFDTASGTCANIYCHGAFPGGDTARVMYFYGGSGEAFCGSCHAAQFREDMGRLRGKHEKHVTELRIFCTTCHFATADVDSSSLPLDTIFVIKIVNARPSLNHVNGVFDVEFDSTIAPLGLFDGTSCNGLPDSPGCHANRRDW